jgi:hypothetical protein
VASIPPILLAMDGDIPIQENKGNPASTVAAKMVITPTIFLDFWKTAAPSSLLLDDEDCIAHMLL